MAFQHWRRLILNVVDVVQDLSLFNYKPAKHSTTTNMYLLFLNLTKFICIEMWYN